MAESYVKVPLVGAVSYLTLAVSPFCITFAALWGVYRDLRIAWIGQDVLVRRQTFLLISGIQLSGFTSVDCGCVVISKFCFSSEFRELP